MKPVMQTRVGILGNCLSACIASLLDYESIPDWLDISAGVDTEWFIKLNAQLIAYIRQLYMQYDFNSPLITGLPFVELLGVAHFESRIVRDRRRKHAVIYDCVAQKVIHDPHPQGIVINSLDEWEPKYIGFLLPR